MLSKETPNTTLSFTNVCFRKQRILNNYDFQGFKTPFSDMNEKSPYKFIAEDVLQSVSIKSSCSGMGVEVCYV